MARIAGINLSKEKQIGTALTAIFGIGRAMSRTILKETKISETTKVQNLSPEEENRLRDKIMGIMTEGDLRRKIQLDIKYQQDIGTYRGLRHKKGLPVRGQLTKTNSRTRKGKKKTVANKKMATK